jgi:hypothetical protein
LTHITTPIILATPYTETPTLKSCVTRSDMHAIKLRVHSERKSEHHPHRVKVLLGLVHAARHLHELHAARRRQHEARTRSSGAVGIQQRGWHAMKACPPARTAACDRRDQLHGRSAGR